MAFEFLYVLALISTPEPDRAVVRAGSEDR